LNKFLNNKANDNTRKSKTRKSSPHSNHNSAAIEDHLNKYEKYSKYTHYDEFSKTEKRNYERNRENLGETITNNYQRAHKDRDFQEQNYPKYSDNYEHSNHIKKSDQTSSRNNQSEINHFDYDSKFDNFKNSENLDNNFTNEKFAERNINKNSFENPVLITPKNYDNKISDKFSTNTFSTIKNSNFNYVDNSADSLNNTNMIGYNPLKINEVSNNDEKINTIKNKINKDVASNNKNVNLDSKSPNRRFDETSINNDFKMLDKLKNKIKDLESKIGEINNGKIINIKV
jgi:hypothetical protein